MVYKNIKFGQSGGITVTGSPDCVTITLCRCSSSREATVINRVRRRLERYFPSHFGFTSLPADSQEVFEARIENCLRDYSKKCQEFVAIDKEQERQILESRAQEERERAKMEAFMGRATQPVLQEGGVDEASKGP